MDQDSPEQIRQIVGATTESLRADIAETRRHTGVLTEGLRHELRLVAEGFQIHLDRRHADNRVYLNEQFRETCALASAPNASRLAGVPAMRISHVVRGQRPMTAELALRPGRYLDQSPRY